MKGRLFFLKLRFASAVVVAGLLFAICAGCEDPKPSMTGRLNAPVDLVPFKGCRQGNDGCAADQEGSLMAIVCADSDDLRLFDMEQRSFFSSHNPLFPLSIPVGNYPVAAAKDPSGEFLFVVNFLSEDLSLVDLEKRIEVDTDRDSTTCAGSLAPRSDRCRAGVSRVPLSRQENLSALAPEDVVVPAGFIDQEIPWDRDQPLPVWISLAGTSQVVRVDFIYPDSQGDLPQRADLVQVLDLGGMPAGMAISRDGALLFVADEDAHSISAIETASGQVTRIDVGGPSRRLALTPDESVLYVVRLDAPLIALVDAVALTRMLPGASDLDTARNPAEDGLAISLPGVPRSIAFVQGSKIAIRDENGASIDYTSELLTEQEREGQEQEVVETFAYVSNMNGNVYLIDAVNHRSIDELPFLGPGMAAVAFVLDKTVYEPGDLQDCYALESCPFPRLHDLDRVYDDQDELEPVFFGVWLTPGVTRTEGWVLTYEGLLPGTDLSSSGRLGPGGLSDTRHGLDFTALGVLSGDRLLISSSPPADEQGSLPAACVAEGQTTLHREFVITSVSPDAVEVEVPAGIDLAGCWPGPVRYEVRAGQSWTVWGTESGLQPRLHMLPHDAAVPETPAYDNGYIALTLFAPGPDEEGQAQSVPRGAAFGFNTDSGFEIYAFKPSIRAGLAGELVAVDIDGAQDDEGATADDRLFLLFEGSNALMEMFPGQFESTNYLLYQ